MSSVRRPRWMENETWQAYQEQVALFKASLLLRLRSNLAEAQADLDADRDDPDLVCWHTARLSILQSQIADADGTAPSQQEAPRPIIVRADRPRKQRHQARGKRVLALLPAEDEGGRGSL